jgi:hypothetical protein
LFGYQYSPKVTLANEDAGEDACTPSEELLGLIKNAQKRKLTKNAGREARVLFIDEILLKTR